MTALLPPAPAQRSAFFDLEYSAAAAYNRFVYRDRAQADAVRGALFDRGIVEFAPPFGLLLLDGSDVVGMIACLPAAALAERRLRCAYMLARSDFYAEDPGLADRIASAAEGTMRVAAKDFYLSRIAVAPAAAGRGHGSRLLAFCEETARAAAAARIVLEVADGNEGAIAFYLGHGFEEADRRKASDPATGRSQAYVHMAKPL